MLLSGTVTIRYDFAIAMFQADTKPQPTARRVQDSGAMNLAELSAGTSAAPDALHDPRDILSDAGREAALAQNCWAAKKWLQGLSHAHASLALLSTTDNATIEDRAAACGQIGSFNIKLGMFDQGIAFYQRAIELLTKASGEDFGVERSLCLRRISAAYYGKGDSATALQYLDASYAVLSAYKAQHRLIRPETLCAFAHDFAQCGDYERAAHMLSELYETSSLLTRSPQAAQRLVERTPG